MNDFTKQFFDLGDANFHLFVDYINEKDALPISLNSTKQMLAQKKQMQQTISDSKTKSMKATASILKVSGDIIDAHMNAA